MTSLLSPAEARVLIKTSLSDPNLQMVIDRVEAQIIENIGAPQSDAYDVQIVRTLRGEGSLLFMPTEIYAVVSIVEDGTTLETDQYQIWAGGVIERCPSGNWGNRILVTYKPADDRPKRKQVIIDLVRLALERTALKQESIAGEYSYTAPSDWDVEFRKAMKRLTFQAV